MKCKMLVDWTQRETYSKSSMMFSYCIEHKFYEFTKEKIIVPGMLL